MQSIKKFLMEEEGAAAIEYGLLAALIAALIIAGVATIGKTLCGVFNGIGTALSTAPHTYTFTSC